MFQRSGFFSYFRRNSQQFYITVPPRSEPSSKSVAVHTCLKIKPAANWAQNRKRKTRHTESKGYNKKYIFWPAEKFWATTHKRRYIFHCGLLILEAKHNTHSIISLQILYLRSQHFLYDLKVSYSHKRRLLSRTRSRQHYPQVRIRHKVQPLLCFLSEVPLAYQ